MNAPDNAVYTLIATIIQSLHARKTAHGITTSPTPVAMKRAIAR